jgi:type IV secretion system protein VirD4
MLSALAFLCRFVGILAFIGGLIPAVTIKKAPAFWVNMIVSNHWEKHDWLALTGWEDWTVVSCVGAALLVVSVLLEKVAPKTVLHGSTAFGSARWSTTLEMREALFQLNRQVRCTWNVFHSLVVSTPSMSRTDGVVLCQEDTAEMRRELGVNGRPKWIVTKPAPLVRVAGHHVLIEAKTGAGKGQGPLLATLLTDRRSCVVLDPKSDEDEGGELYKFSAGFRDTFSTVRRFAPTEVGWHRFNPLLEIPLGKDKDHPHPHEGKEAYRIANVLTGAGAKEDSDSRIFWKTAELLMTCAILDRLWHGKRPEDRSLPGVFRMLTERGKTPEQIRDAIVERSPKSAEHHANRLALVDVKKGILQGGFENLLEVISYCGDETIARNLEVSDFRLSDLSQGSRPLSLYLAFPFADADILKPLARLMTNMLIASHLRTPRHTQQTVYLLDEFDDLGYLPALIKAITKIRSYGVQLVLVTQTRQQIYAIYEHHADILLDNLAVQAVWGVSGRNAAQKIAEALGKATISEEFVARGTSTKGWLDPETKSVNRSVKEHGRDLMTADEVMNSAGNRIALFGPEMHPYLGMGIFCYSMDAFGARSSMPAPMQRRAA